MICDLLSTTKQLKTEHVIFATKWLESVEQELTNGGNFLESSSLVGGWSGSALLLGALTDMEMPPFLQEQTEVLLFRCFETIAKLIERETLDLSLHQGLFGICYALSVATKKYNHFTSTLDALENFTADHIYREWIIPLEKAAERKIVAAPSLYNLSQGASGCLSYLLSADSTSPALKNAETALIDVLASYLMTEYSYEGRSVPSWFSEPMHVAYAEEKWKYPNGFYTLSHMYGLCGLLAALTTACEKRPELVVKLSPVIRKIADWLERAGENRGDTWVWPGVISHEEFSALSYETQLNRDTLTSGIFPTALTLYRAAKILGDESLQSSAELYFSSVFNKSTKEWNMMAASLFSGRAGCLLCLFRMYEQTQNAKIAEMYNELAIDTERFFRPNTQFGFQSVSVSPSGNYSWEDDNSLITGATGILLGLLTPSIPQESPWSTWDRMVLTV